MNNPITTQNVFFTDGSWHCRKKCISKTMETEYLIEGGYDTEEAATLAYADSINSYNKKINSLQKSQSIQMEFKEHLIVWYHKIFIPRSDNQTQIIAAYALYHFIIPSMPLELQEKLLLHVTVTDLNKLLESCNDFCDTSGAQSYKFLNAFFTDAFMDHYIKENPMHYVKKYNFKNTPKDIIVYTKEQFKLFLSYAYKNYPQHFFEIYCGFIGLRCGEIRGLNLNDFCVDNSSVHIQRQIVRENELFFTGDDVALKHSGITIKSPKTYSSDRILRIPKVYFYLIEQRKKDILETKEQYRIRNKEWNSEYEGKGYLCIGNGGNIKNEGTINQTIKKICSALQLPVITIHILRHMAASLMFEYGSTNIILISSYLGHSNPATTFDLYVHQIEYVNKIRVAQDSAMNPSNHSLSYSGGLYEKKATS